MPDQPSHGERTPEQRQADHASLERLSETLVPALVAKVTGTGLGELEVREGEWRVRVRRPVTAPSTAPRRGERSRLATATHPHAVDARPARGAAQVDVGTGGATRAIATSPAVGVFRPGLAIGTAVHAGDRIAIVDLLGIPQDVLAPIDGTLVEIFAQGGEAVEYGEEIAAVEAAPDQASDASVDGAAGAPGEEG